MLATHNRRLSKLAALTLTAFCLIAAAICRHPTNVTAQASPTGPAPASVEFYTQKVKPIFQENCYRCHGGMNRRGGFKLDTQSGLLRGGKDGSAVVPGHPEQSLLLALIRHEGPAADPKPMPPRKRLSEADIATVTAWIKAGAIMPKDNE